MEPTIEHVPTRMMEDVTKRIEFIVALQRHKLSMTIEPMYLPNGMTLIDRPDLVIKDSSS